HLVHQWKTPFRAPYSGGSSFLQLIQLRHVLQHALEKSNAAPVVNEPAPAVEEPAPVKPIEKIAEFQVMKAAPEPVEAPPQIAPGPQPAAPAIPQPQERREDDGYLGQCITDIHQIAIVFPTLLRLRNSWRGGLRPR